MLTSSSRDDLFPVLKGSFDGGSVCFDDSCGHCGSLGCGNAEIEVAHGVIVHGGSLVVVVVESVHGGSVCFGDSCGHCGALGHVGLELREKGVDGHGRLKAEMIDVYFLAHARSVGVSW